MNKKIILSIAASTVLASSLFAFGCKGDMKKGCDFKNSKHKMMKKGCHHKKNGKIMKMLKMLDLTDEQKVQVKKIMQDNMKNMTSPYSAFSDSNFDKDKFIKISKEMKGKRIEGKANLISKIYAVLNDSQKKDLKTMLDMKEIMKKKMMKQKGDCSAKNCNGRG